jgi:hypothetical protein
MLDVIVFNSTNLQNYFELYRKAKTVKHFGLDRSVNFQFSKYSTNLSQSVHRNVGPNDWQFHTRWRKD